MHAQGYFITGTDTGCGKTEITLGLMSLFQERGLQVQGMKPVASGAEPVAGALRNQDALRIQARCSLPLSYERINPYAFAPPIAPHLAAREAGVTIDIDHIRDRFQELGGDLRLVEGVGGWLVPLNAGHTVADLAAALELPVILVVGMRLGCINHALLTARSILDHGCRLAGWVANRVAPEMLAAEDNIDTLRQRIPAPLLAEVPFLPAAGEAAVARALSPLAALMP